MLQLKWASDCCVTPIELFSATCISWWEQVTLKWGEQLSTGRHDAPLGQSILSRFRANQSLLFLLNAACITEKQQIPILVFDVTRSGLEPTIYRTRGEHANHYPTDAIILQLEVFQIIATQMSEVTAADDPFDHANDSDINKIYSVTE